MNSQTAFTGSLTSSIEDDFALALLGVNYPVARLALGSIVHLKAVHGTHLLNQIVLVLLHGLLE